MDENKGARLRAEGGPGYEGRFWQGGVLSITTHDSTIVTL
jgi:hypothetical protein